MFYRDLWNFIIRRIFADGVFVHTANERDERKKAKKKFPPSVSIVGRLGRYKISPLY